MINGVARVVAQTYFLDDDDAIRIGGREVKRPFTIEAIGDPAPWPRRPASAAGSSTASRTAGERPRCPKVDKITITALADVKSPEYARPAS